MTPILSLHTSLSLINPLPKPKPKPTTTTKPRVNETQVRRESMKATIEYLESLSINSTKALTLNPELYTTPLENLQVIESTLLNQFHLPRSSLGRILDTYPSLLTTPPSHTLLPVSHFLTNQIPLSPYHLPLSVLRCPRLLVSNPDKQLLPTLLFLRHRLNLRITPHTTLLLVSDVDKTLIPKIDFLRHLGFHEDVVVNMIQRSPAILTYSIHNNLTPKLDYYLNHMRCQLTEITRFPQFFSFSLDKRIKPRHRLLEEHGVSMSLKDMLKVSDGEFEVRLREKSSRLTVLRMLKVQTALKTILVTGKKKDVTGSF